MKYVKSFGEFVNENYPVKPFEIYESESFDNEEALYEFDLPGFWEIFGAGAAWEAGKAIGALALALLAMGGYGLTVGLLQIKDKISELIRERKRVKGAAEGQDFLLKNPKIQEIAKISKELWEAQAGKVDRRRKDWEEKLSNLKIIAKDLTKKRQKIAKEIAADIKEAGLSKEAVEYLGTQVSYLGTSYFTKTLMKESVDEVKSVKVGDFIKTEYGYYYKRVAGNVGGQEAFVEIKNGKEGKRKTGIHSSTKFEIVDISDMSESVNEAKKLSIKQISQDIEDLLSQTYDSERDYRKSVKAVKDQISQLLNVIQRVEMDFVDED